MTRRAALEAYLGSSHTFTGEIAAFRMRYVLLWNVHQADRFVTNHVWMRRGEFVPGWQFYLGDCIRFEAAQLLDRRFIGCELDPHWSAVARNRLRLPFQPVHGATESDLSDLPLFADLAS